MKKILLLGVLFSGVLLNGCFSVPEISQKPSTEASDSLYVFDEIPADSVKTHFDKVAVSAPDTLIDDMSGKSVYSVQIGAFTSEAKAKSFQVFAKKKLKRDLAVSYNNQVKLYVVQVQPPFRTKKDAELLRDELWKMKEFKDAWISRISK